MENVFAFLSSNVCINLRGKCFWLFFGLDLAFSEYLGMAMPSIANGW